MGSGQVQTNGYFVKGVLGKGVHLLLDGLQEKNICSLLLFETGKPCTAVTKCQTCWKLQFWHSPAADAPHCEVCLLRPSNLMEFKKFYGFLGKFNSSLTQCSKCDGKVHWLHGRNTEWTEAGGVTQGPENTNIKEEPPTGSRGSD